MFDPGGVTGLPTARWSPLEATVTSSGALRTGRALAQAIPKGGVTNAEYWAEHGEGLLGAFMCVAGLSRLLRDDAGNPMKPIGMEQLAAWVRTLATATDPTIHGLITRALDNRDNIEIQLLGRHAATTFTGVAREDDKIRSSVYSHRGARVEALARTRCRPLRVGQPAPLLLRRRRALATNHASSTSTG